MPPKRAAGSASPPGLGSPPAPSPKKPKPQRERIERTATVRREAPAGGRAFKAVSYNVAGLRSLFRGGQDAEAAKAKAQVLQQVIQAEDPDLFCLQEHKLQTIHVEDIEPKLAQLLPGYRFHWTCSTAKKGYAGVVAGVKVAGGAAAAPPPPADAKAAAAALFRPASQKKAAQEAAAASRPALEPTVHVGLGMPAFDQEYNREGRTLVAEYEDFTVVMVYVPNSGQNLVRLDRRLNEWEADMRGFLKELDARKPVILLGDLNTAHLDADIWNVTAKHIPKQAGCTPQERAAFDQLLAECGMKDSFKHFYPDSAGWFTYWSQRAGNRAVNRGLRLDYALCSERLLDGASTPQVYDSFILADESLGLSDHCAMGFSLTY